MNSVFHLSKEYFSAQSLCKHFLIKYEKLAQWVESGKETSELDSVVHSIKIPIHQHDTMYIPILPLYITYSTTQMRNENIILHIPSLLKTSEILFAHMSPLC